MPTRSRPAAKLDLVTRGTMPAMHVPDAGAFAWEIIRRRVDYSALDHAAAPTFDRGSVSIIDIADDPRAHAWGLRFRRRSSP